MERDCFSHDKDSLYDTLNRTTAWIENCDNKTSIVLTGVGVLIAIILSGDYVKKIKKIIEHMLGNLNFYSVMFMFITTMAVIVCLIGLYFLFRVLVPKTNTKLYKERNIQTDSLIYFYSIAKNKSYSDYKSKLEKCSESSWENDIISQIYICSIICRDKFDYYKKGLKLIVSAFILFSIMMIIGLFIV